MLYDKTMKKTGRIELKLKNGKTILVSMVGLKEGDALMVRFNDNFLSSNKFLSLSGEKVNAYKNSFATCHNMVLNNDDVTMGTFIYPELRITKDDGKRFAISGSSDEKRYTILKYTDVGEIKADNRLWILLLNAGIVTAEEDALKRYEMLPRFRIYGKDESGKKKVKIYLG